MGYFTFTFANKTLIEKSYGYDRRCVLGYGAKGYIALPKGFENLYQDSSIVVNRSTGYAFVKENFYDGYGMFGEHDIYEVVVEINKGYLVECINKVMDANLDETKTDGYQDEMVRKRKLWIEIATKYEADASEEELEELFGTEYYKDSPNLWNEWKRHLGIFLACYKRDNELLHFPLKVVSSTRKVIYEQLPASDSTQ